MIEVSNIRLNLLIQGVEVEVNAKVTNIANCAFELESYTLDSNVSTNDNEIESCILSELNKR